MKGGRSLAILGTPLPPPRPPSVPEEATSAVQPQRRCGWAWAPKCQGGSRSRQTGNHSPLLNVFLTLPVLVALWHGAMGDVPPSERAALMALFSSTNGPSWRVSTSWNVGDPCVNAWFQVGCSGMTTVTCVPLATATASSQVHKSHPHAPLLHPSLPSTVVVQLQEPESWHEWVIWNAAPCPL